MKFFAPAPSSNERARLIFGLVKMSQCFNLSLAPIESLRLLTLPPKVKNLQIEGKNENPEAGKPSQDGFDIGVRQSRAVAWGSIFLALLQSLCTAVFAISGVRVAIGLSALAAVSGIYAPATGWHQDAIRIPMLIFATLGAIMNLAVIGWIRHLRNLPSAHWRRREPGAKEKRSARLQIALAIITLILVGLETWTHTLVHRKGPPPPCRIARTC